eukprot:CAMPEP_0117679094 /NCGR_PEP_ID=MMETSP0804-20121206/17640_1 /TAXON_ID=1074897 /ORGANISM="Tetraselmis astigmatica, Strain CCMP880" /LENGTH=558 /DNA_ID=CAMNT_0005488511 /DNA_START=32 /DNA_END=1709 /DNA_ORIENTATION=-
MRAFSASLLLALLLPCLARGAIAVPLPRVSDDQTSAEISHDNVLPPVPVSEGIRSCRQAVVGGGWSGVYFFFRLAAANPAEAGGVCLFEGTHRLGGRTYSVRVDAEFTLDVGAYRFSPDMHLPGDVILKVLELPTDCYELGCPSPIADFPPPMMFNYTQPLRRIVNPETGLPGGYETAVQQLAKLAQELGAKIFLNTKLVDIKAAGALQSAEEIALAPDSVFLNVPRQQMVSFPSAASDVPPRTWDMLHCVVFEVPPSLFPNATDLTGQNNTTLSKAYAYYSDAWWRTKLSKLSGNFPSDTGFFPMKTSSGMYFMVHWGDGPVSCSSGIDGEESCHGFLEVYYSVSNETFFSSIPSGVNTTLGIISRSDADPASSAKLDMLHAALMEAIEPVLQESGVGKSELVLPDKLVVGVWRRPDEQHPAGEGYWYTAPTKVYWSSEVSGTAAQACGMPGLTEEEYAASLLQPWGRDVPVFLANNDYFMQDTKYMYGDWAEDSLLQAERALLRFGLARPDWLDADYHKRKVVAMDLWSPSAGQIDLVGPRKERLSYMDGIASRYW